MIYTMVYIMPYWRFVFGHCRHVYTEMSRGQLKLLKK